MTITKFGAVYSRICSSVLVFIYLRTISKKTFLMKCATTEGRRITNENGNQNKNISENEHKVDVTSIMHHGAVSARPDGTTKVTGMSTFIFDVPYGTAPFVVELDLFTMKRIELNMNTAIYRTGGCIATFLRPTQGAGGASGARNPCTMATHRVNF
jgi:hypothetical protein